MSYFKKQFSISILALLILSCFLLCGCSKPSKPELPDISQVLAPLSVTISPEEIANYELEKYGSADHTSDTYQNGNIAYIFGNGIRKYIFANDKLHSFYFYGVDSFPASIEQLKEIIGEPSSITGDSYMLWNAAFNDTPVTVVYTKNPVNEAKTYLSFEIQK